MAICQKNLNGNCGFGSHRWLGAFFSVLAIAVGWFIPQFYDWTGADQSRPSPIVPRIGVVIVVANIGLMLALLFDHIRSRRKQKSSSNEINESDRGGKHLQFSLGQLLQATTFAVLILLIGRWYSPDTVAWLIFGLTVGCAIWIAFRNTLRDGESLSLPQCNSAPFSGISEQSDQHPIFLEFTR